MKNKAAKNKRIIVLLLAFLLVMQYALPVLAEDDIPSTHEEAVETIEDEPVPESAEPAVLEYEDKHYKVTASGSVPEGAVLRVEKIKENEEAEYINTAEKELGTSVSALRLMDISFVKDDEKIEPDGPVDIHITCLDDISVEDKDNIRILHFPEEKKTEVMDAETTVKESTLKEVSFASGNFSVYAIVEIQIPEEEPESDPLGIGGKSYGIVNYKSGTYGVGMLNSTKDSTHIAARNLLVRENPMNRTELLLDGEGSSIAMWLFESVGGSKYKLYMTSGNRTNYISVTSAGSTLTTDSSQATELTITPGTGANEGKFRITNDDGRAINLTNGSVSKGFGSGNDNSQNEWHYLVDLSNIQEENYVTYTAKKVSVSDTESVPDGAEVIVYTRIWNNTDKAYEYYGIDQDGSLFRVYVSGDTIQWVGTEFNTALWKFTEYTYDNGKPNYYYELQNTYSNKYLSPQIGQSALADSPIGININGRRYGNYYSQILAWDNPHYDYAGLKADSGSLVSDTMSNAGDFYFAIMKDPETEGKLTPVATVEHKQFGITMKMQDYENAPTSGSNRSREQSSLLGETNYAQWTGTKNLLSRTADQNGYPTATYSGRSLEELYDETIEVDNHFLLKTYQESGYFEYNSTQNFAHLIADTSDKWYGQPAPGGGTYDVGDFVVYEQLGTSTETNKDTLKHGQYLPYNDLTEDLFSNYKNERDIHAVALSPYDPRKGEKLYAIPYQRSQTSPDYVNHFFGMEMTASFMQSADGLDAWGHDLIFEFSGDDDFWLYVDDILVLDLGGIHSALDGSVNFCTGTVVENGTTKTLRSLYEQGYKSKYPSATNEEVTEWLDKIFKDGGTVFKDYTGHTMHMFYMERGAGASNLHMKFNLTTIQDGDLSLTKEITGTDKADFTSVRFPYQIFWREEGETNWTRLSQDVVPSGTSSRWSATYKDTNTPLDYDAEAIVNGAYYQDVFYLKPGESADIHLGSDDREYYIKEVGVNTDIYDQVYGNRIELSGEAPSDIRDAAQALNTEDFAIETDTVGNRKSVHYTNHVQESSLKTLSVTKHLYREDYDGTRESAHELKYPEDPSQTDPSEYDDTTFRYRIYLSKTAPEDGDDLNDYYYRFGVYYIKDPQGNYCKYTAGTGFVSLGKTNFDDLTDREKQEASFRTSMNGTADHIPARYTLEIRNLLSDTWFMIEEKNSEMPRGYTRLGNTDDPNDIDGYERDGGSFITGKDPNQGWTRDNNSPHLLVNNKRGFGLMITKKWTDSDYMADRDPIYVALYKNGSMVPGTLRQIAYDQTMQYYYYDQLPLGGELADYHFREVTITGTPDVDEQGIVTNEASLTAAPITNKIILHGKMTGSSSSDPYEYKVTYKEGQPSGGDSNFRSDSIVNTRPGIKIVKEDMAGNPLAGAEFSLFTQEDETVGKPSYASGEDGLVTIAYLKNGTYKIKETSSPRGYQTLLDEFTLTVEGGQVTVMPQDAGVSVEEDPSHEMTAIVKIKNRPFTLKAKKVDAMNDNAPMANVKFSLYRELESTNGTLIKDYNPISGYENLVSDANGFIPGIDETLSPGTYYLSEVRAPSGYNKAQDVRFTVTEKGQIICENSMFTLETVNNTCNYLMTIPNTRGYELKVTKVWNDGVAVKEWPVDSSGNDIPITLTLKRKTSSGTVDQSFEKTLRATSDSLTFVTGADSSLVPLVNANSDGGYDLIIVGLPEDNGNGQAWVYFLQETVVTGYTREYINDSGRSASELRNGYTVKNTEKAVILQKLDDYDETTPLRGAEFGLFTDQECTQPAANTNGTIIQVSPTNADGYTSLGTLPNGHYYLKETKAPNGYGLMSDIEITVSGGTIKYTKDGVWLNAVTQRSKYYIKAYDPLIPAAPTGIAKARKVVLLTIIAFGTALYVAFRSREKRKLSPDQAIR